MIFRSSTRSPVDLAMGPTLSLFEENGNPPAFETVPGVVRIVYNAARIAGFVKDPLKSAPMETGAKPALTATADPVEEPEGFYSSVRLPPVLKWWEYSPSDHRSRHQRLLPSRRLTEFDHRELTSLH